MSKPFLTYQQQLQKLTIDKHLVIIDSNLAVEKLRDLGYFSLIGGYKHPFRNPMTRLYEKNTTFEDILALYQFDNDLRELIFKHLCQIEKKLRSLLSYAFCEFYGEQQNHYLNPNNYNFTAKNQRGINKLIGILTNLALNNTDYEYLTYQRNTYNNVPLWVLVNAMTFGQISKMYSFLLPHIRSKISQNFIHVNDKALEQFLKVLVLYRNVCAHNERLYSNKVYSEIPNTILHHKLGIPLTGAQYVMGKKDLFSVIIAFRYLLPRKTFLAFKTSLARLIAQYLRKSNRITEATLLAEMGFPSNWKRITRYQI